MLKLTGRYAKALLEFAREQGMGEIYRQALLLAADKKALLLEQLPGELGAFLHNVPPEEREPVLFRFLGLAREEMDLMEVEIISAVPLTSRQLEDIEVKLIHMFRKQLEITTRLDPSILGGLRVIAGSTVFDNTIKRQLMDMKSSIYKGVYLGA